MSRLDVSNGFSLVELLVALVVASIGLLGVATLSLQASRYNMDAKHRNLATILASDMADRIRLNRVDAITTYTAAIALADPASNNCDTTTCSTADRAEQDVFEWLEDITSQLPNGDGLIADNDPELTVTVQWSVIQGDFLVDRDGAASGTDTKSVSISVLP